MTSTAHHHHHGHGHSHGLVNESIKRSRAGVRAVAVALEVLALTAVAQAVVYALSGSVALLADLIHNAGDALTAVPLAVAGAVGFAAPATSPPPRSAPGPGGACAAPRSSRTATTRGRTPTSASAWSRARRSSRSASISPTRSSAWASRS